MYSGFLILSARITLNRLAIPARNTSAFVVLKLLVFQFAICMFPFKCCIVCSTTARFLYWIFHSIVPRSKPGKLRRIEESLVYVVLPRFASEQVFAHSNNHCPFTNISFGQYHLIQLDRPFSFRRTSSLNPSY